jgi:type II secretory pathway pseudopilin PulG
LLTGYEFRSRQQAVVAAHLRSGFSLLELTLVLLVLALGGALIGPRSAALDDASLNIQAEQLRRDLSRVQLLAASRAQRLRVSAAGNTYQVLCVLPVSCAGVPVPDPETGGAFAATLRQGAAFTAATELDFDSLGRPTEGGALKTTPTAFRVQRGSHGVDVVVLPLTGFAQVAGN